MGVVEDLVRAREAYDRREWVAAYEDLSRIAPTELDPGDFSSLATAALLLGRQNDSIQAFQRAYREYLDAGVPLSAARCGFWLARTLAVAGEAAVASGWAARVGRLLDEVDGDVVERGYLRILEMYRHIGSGEWGPALDCAVAVEDYGRRFDDPDLTAMGLVAQGRLLLYHGRVPEGLALFDEAMTGLAAGEVSIVFSGDIYCTMVEGCQEVSDLGRAAEWTQALSAWCDDQDGLVAFTGQCAVHRGQIMRLRGAYDEALGEFDAAVERYLRAGTVPAAGLSHSERGDVLRLRGDLGGAEAAYEEAAQHGHDPQPGLALLWLAQGRVDAAAGAARRLAAEPADPVRRSQLLPALCEILLAGSAPDEAETLAGELAEIAEAFETPALSARASFAAGSLALHRGDGAAALPELRSALQTWADLDAPFEVARCRLRIGSALASLGDEPSARAEWEGARQAFADLGAHPGADEAAKLLGRGETGGLSARELEVLALVAEGRTNREIAEALVLSEKTVARHLSNIFTKLDVTTRTAAAAYAFEQGLV